tara:strand:- start:147 stop:743 length:597 start_codon:yes stop_codon:yes gene_type:complete
MKRSKQIPLLKPSNLSYGGTLLKTRKGRQHGRPIDTKSSMHLVLRSSQAKGPLSFRTKKNQQSISRITQKFSKKFGIQVLSLANVGNHLHFHIKISKRRAYMSFIRAITSAIRMAVAGNPRWTDSKIIGKFWDYRPFSRVVRGRQAFLDVEDYITINRIEGLGLPKTQARLLMGHIQNRRKIFRSKSAGGNVEIALLC